MKRYDETMRRKIIKKTTFELLARIARTETRYLKKNKTKKRKKNPNVFLIAIYIL